MNQKIQICHDRSLQTKFLTTFLIGVSNLASEQFTFKNQTRTEKNVSLRNKRFFYRIFRIYHLSIIKRPILFFRSLIPFKINNPNEKKNAVIKLKAAHL